MIRPEITNKHMFKAEKIGFEQDLYILYIAEDPVKKLVKMSWSQKEFEDKISAFSNKYKEDAIELVEYFNIAWETYYREYKNKEVIKKKKETKKEEEARLKKERAELILYSLYKSGLSVEQYASTTLSYDIKDIEDAIRFLEPKCADKILKALSLKNTREFYENLDRLERVLSDSIVDYFLETKLSISDLKKVLRLNDTAYSNVYPKSLKKEMYRTPEAFKRGRIGMVYTSPEGVVVDKEANEEIFKFMESNQIPYTDEILASARKKYIAEKLAEKVKTK